MCLEANVNMMRSMILLGTVTDLTQPVDAWAILLIFCKDWYKVSPFLVDRTFLNYHVFSWMTAALQSYHLNELLSILE